MLIGYARVFTDDQHLDGQRAALRAAGCQRVYDTTAQAHSLLYVEGAYGCLVNAANCH
jgi:hypothetical protein